MNWVTWWAVSCSFYKMGKIRKEVFLGWGVSGVLFDIVNFVLPNEHPHG